MDDLKEEFKIYDMAQNTPEWFKVRAGKITGSKWEALDVNGKGLGGLGTGAITTMYEMIGEILTGEPAFSFSNKATEWGHTYEPEAISYHEAQTFKKIQRVGFVQLNKWVGCSPDGLEGDDGMIQVKCLPKEHVRILCEKQPDKSHVKQIQFEMYAAKREYSTLVYYHPLHPEKTRYKACLLYTSDAADE